MQLMGWKKSAGEVEGRKFSGFRLYLLDDVTEVLEGTAVTTCFISDQKISPKDLILGSEYKLVYNKYGKVQDLELIEAATS